MEGLSKLLPCLPILEFGIVVVTLMSAVQITLYRERPKELQMFLSLIEIDRIHLSVVKPKLM
jgi:hypothetical protein